MKIVIAGAGAVGFNLAELLSKENQDITLIDSNEDVLHHAGTHLDVSTLRGDAASIEVLNAAGTELAELFIAVTTSQSTNLLLAILAKQCGAKRTIARVNNPEYFETKQKENFQRLGIDVLISPQLLAAEEIKRLLRRGSFTDIYEFEGGKISILGFTIDGTSPFLNKNISEIGGLGHTEFSFRGIALLRGQRTIIPRGRTKLRQGDHLYISIKESRMDLALNTIGKQLKPIKNVMIIGDTNLAMRTAKLIENDYHVVSVVSSKDKGNHFLENLDESLVVKADYSNVEVLKEEGLEKMDAFIALTPNSETNIITSLMAEEFGVYRTIAQVDNVYYTHISKNIGVDTIINQKLIAANNIFRFVRKGKVEAIASLHGVDAEIIEFEIFHNSELLEKPIRKLKLPIKSIVAGVIRDDKGIIPDGDFQFQLKDKVIIFCLPEAIHLVEEIFK